MQTDAGGKDFIASLNPDSLKVMHSVRSKGRW